MTDKHAQIYTVSQLTGEIKDLLEENFPFVWIDGEISNFRAPSSGHFYFTLKDEDAQINAVMFRGQNRVLKFLPEDGLAVRGLGRIAVYEPRGNYQLILEYLAPKGVGELQKAFEQLKSRLSSDGLFDEGHKKPIPFLPRKISVITSPSGAVIQDILNVANRRFSNIPIEVFSVKVQGDGAESDIEAAFKWLNIRGDSDVIILARGGGSLEDLEAFNSETVAQAIFESEIPVISGVGHETDVTIADFVADLRAPTPSAAAELALPLKSELAPRIAELSSVLSRRFYHYVENQRFRFSALSQRLVHPSKKIENFRLRVDYFTQRILRHMARVINQQRERTAWQSYKLWQTVPDIQDQREQVFQLKKQLNLGCRIYFQKKDAYVQMLSEKLGILDPKAVLCRGYSITQNVSDQLLVQDAHNVHLGQKLDVRLAKGTLRCRVQGIILDNDSKTTKL